VLGVCAQHQRVSVVAVCGHHAVGGTNGFRDAPLVPPLVQCTNGKIPQFFVGCRAVRIVLQTCA
jgi:hypothetical protein